MDQSPGALNTLEFVLYVKIVGTGNVELLSAGTTVLILRVIGPVVVEFLANGRVYSTFDHWGKNLVVQKCIPADVPW